MRAALKCAVLLSGFALVRAQVECKHDAYIEQVPITSSLMKRSAVLGHRNKDGPVDTHRGKRSIARCRGLVESVSVPEEFDDYLGVPLGGVVSIVESESPWSGIHEEGEITPICSGIFVGESKVLTSAHCVFHQRRSWDDARFWLFGDDSVRRRYFYAVSGKSSSSDSDVSVYPLQTACIPQSYATADNETVTSGQMNDVAIFTTLAPFRGSNNSIAEFVYKLPAGSSMRDYMLPQYPLDVASGTQLVIDVATSPLYKTTYFGGTFYSVDLVSWIGSSGGAIIDVGESRYRNKPVLAGILMSEGWQVCDSGILPMTSYNEIFYKLIEAAPLKEPVNPPGEVIPWEEQHPEPAPHANHDDAVNPPGAPPPPVSNTSPTQPITEPWTTTESTDVTTEPVP